MTHQLCGNLQAHVFFTKNYKHVQCRWCIYKPKWEITHWVELVSASLQSLCSVHLLTLLTVSVPLDLTVPVPHLLTSLTVSVPHLLTLLTVSFPHLLTLLTVSVPLLTVSVSASLDLIHCVILCISWPYSLYQSLLDLTHCNNLFLTLLTVSISSWPYCASLCTSWPYCVSPSSLDFIHCVSLCISNCVC